MSTGELGHKEALEAANAAREEERKKRAVQTASAPKVPAMPTMPKVPKKQRFAALPDGSKLYIHMHLTSDTPTKPTLNNVFLWRKGANTGPFGYRGDYFGWRQRDMQGHLPVSLVCPQSTQFDVLGMSKSKEDAERDFEQQMEKYWKSKLQEDRRKVDKLQGEAREVVNQTGSKVVTWNVGETPVMWHFFDILEVDVGHRVEVKAN